jgi:hypothetical protein
VNGVRLAAPDYTAAALVEELGPPFKRARGGPGEWVILFEPELHLGSDILVPDLGGWRVERMPELVDDDPYFTLAPDWICEVLSPRSAKYDRTWAPSARSTSGNLAKRPIRPDSDQLGRDA